MLLKSADSKDQAIVELESLLAECKATGTRSKIEQELRILRAGIKGEKEAAYLIDFDFKHKDNFVVIHDLRLEVNGRVAQIDHLLINRLLNCIVLETKHFNSGLKITESGDFLRWNNYSKTYVGMASPLAQNERHISVLKDAFSVIEMPTRLSIRLIPDFVSYILVSPHATIERPTSRDTSQVIKADMLRQTWHEKIDTAGVAEMVGGFSKMISSETLMQIGHRLVALHKPLSINYREKFGIPENQDSRPEAVDTELLSTLPKADTEVSGPQCQHCRANQGAIVYGKYGYYLKCSACDGNTSIKVSCGKPGHKERVRKESRKFFRECADCETSYLYFVNPATDQLKA